MTRFSGSPTSSSTTCDPTWPAPPVTRIVRAVMSFARRRGDSRDRPAPDRVVLEAELRHAVERIQVSPIDDDRLLQHLLDAGEIRMAVLVPIGHDRERVGTRRGLITRRRELDA